MFVLSFSVFESVYDVNHITIWFPICENTHKSPGEKTFLNWTFCRGAKFHPFSYRWI